MRLYHNLTSLNIFRNQTKNLQLQSKALNNISSGLKVNSAKDNPNAIAQSERMRIQIRGLQMASQNVQDGASMLQAVDGNLNSVTAMLQRIKELTIQAGGAGSDADKEVIQSEIKQMIQGIDQTVSNGEFNGINIIHDAKSDNTNPIIKKLPVGANVDETIDIPKYNLSTDAIGSKTTGKKLSQIDVTTEEGLNSALDTIDGAIETILSVRSKYGALENRLQSSYDNMNSIEVSMQGAESSLRDADIASEMIEYSKDGILIEAGNAMMVQSNNLPKDILRVLENVKS